MTYTLPAGFTMRRPMEDDIPAYVELNRVYQQLFEGRVTASEQEARAHWQMFNDPARDRWFVFAPDGRLAGTSGVGSPVAEQLITGAMVHLDFNGIGLTDFLLEKALERAREKLPEAKEDVRVTANKYLYPQDHENRDAYLRAGFTHVRSMWEMRIDMDQLPPVPIWPEGLELRPFSAEQIPQLHQADNDAFADHWGYIPFALEDFHQFFQNDFTDLALNFLVWDEDEIAGYALCEKRGEEGVVGVLGVRRPWRKQGLGLALLHHTFGEFLQRGTRTVTLNVDSQNLTGATRLYTRAGMHIANELHQYQLELRPGVELGVTELAE